MLRSRRRRRARRTCGAGEVVRRVLLHGAAVGVPQRIDADRRVACARVVVGDRSDLGAPCVEAVLEDEHGHAGPSRGGLLRERQHERDRLGPLHDGGAGSIHLDASELRWSRREERRGVERPEHDGPELIVNDAGGVSETGLVVVGRPRSSSTAAPAKHTRDLRDRRRSRFRDVAHLLGDARRMTDREHRRRADRPPRDVRRERRVDVRERTTTVDRLAHRSGHAKRRCLDDAGDAMTLLRARSPCGARATSSLVSLR